MMISREDMPVFQILVKPGLFAQRAFISIGNDAAGNLISLREYTQ